MGPQLARPQELKGDEAQKNAHILRENWQDGVNLPKRFEKVRVKRAFELGNSISGVGRNIGGLAKDSHAESLSDLPKAGDLSMDLGKGLRGQDNPGFDRETSLLEESKLHSDPTLSRSSSFPILSSEEAQELHRIQILEGLDRDYKPFSELTEDFIRYKSDEDFIEIDPLSNAMKSPEKEGEEKDELAFLAHFALYTEQLLFQSAIDGESNVKIQQLGTRNLKNTEVFMPIDWRMGSRPKTSCANR